METYHHTISTAPLDFEALEKIGHSTAQLELSKEAKRNIKQGRAYLDLKIKSTDTPVYGINTGFGALCNTSISKEDLARLQENLVMSHAAGMGEEVAADIVKWMLFLKIQSLSYGHSGVHEDTVNRLVDFYNQDVLPIVYAQGSLGASGDLAPLAHLALPLIGKGEVRIKGERTDAGLLSDIKGFKPLQLKSKEGLALLNGTQFMGALGVSSILKLRHLIRWADWIAALSLEAFDGRIDPFHPAIHQVRPHPGQVETARTILHILEGSALAQQPKQAVQDPYSFRCVPQVHGATKDALAFAEQVFIREINAVTDNPMIFPEHDMIVSGGNFHGQPLALAMDFLAIAVAEIGSISERRVYQLVNGQRKLPDFLTPEPGLNSGFMIVQYTAASIVSQNKQLATPASVDTIDSSRGQEDHVSMGANAGTKLLRIVHNIEQLLAIELFVAAQAFEFRKKTHAAPALQKLVKDFRKNVPFLQQDEYMHPHMQKALAFIQHHSPQSYL